MYEVEGTNYWIWPISIAFIVMSSFVVAMSASCAMNLRDFRFSSSIFCYLIWSLIARDFASTVVDVSAISSALVMRFAFVMVVDWILLLEMLFMSKVSSP